MPIPPFIAEIRELIGHREMWLPAVTAVVTRDREREVLLVRRADNGQWAPVTGIVDPGEQAATAAAREALEETGVVVRVERLTGTDVQTGVVHANGDVASYLDVTFWCTWVSGEAHVADDESVDVAWFPVDALPDVAPHLLSRIDSALSGEQAARFTT